MPMSLEITVAVVAHELPRFARPIGINGFERRYADRTKVSLKVRDEETLASVYQRAVDQLQPQVVPSPGFPLDYYSGNPMDVVRWAMFYEKGDDDGLGDLVGRWEVVEELITVDGGGVAQWGRAADEIPYEDLVRAAERGLLSGDPLRPYIVFLLPQYDGGALQLAWDAFLETWKILDGLLTAYGIIKLIPEARPARLRRRIAGLRVMAENFTAWSERRGGPLEVTKTLRRRSWSVDELRIALDLPSNEEAAEMLGMFGFSPDADGVYAMGEDIESTILQQIAEAASRGDLSPDDEQTIGRLEQTLATGTLPNRRWD